MFDFKGYVHWDFDHFISIAGHEPSVFMGKAEVLFANVGEVDAFLVRTNRKFEPDFSIESGTLVSLCGEEGDFGDPHER